MFSILHEKSLKILHYTELKIGRELSMLKNSPCIFNQDHQIL